MKSLTIALSVILLLAMISLGFSTLAQPSHIPHENPATTDVPPDDPASLLRFYANVFDQITVRQYQGAQNMLEEAIHLSIPAGLKDTMDSFNRLSSQLVTTLNSLESLLDEASSLFSQRQFSEARQKLDDAGVAIQRTQFLLDDMEAGTNTLGDNLGIFNASPGSQVRQVYDELKMKEQQRRQLVNELTQLWKSLAEDPEMAITTSFYYPTTLEVSAPESAHPGIPITVSGRVSSEGGTVDRTVRILLDNTQLTEERVRDQFSLQVIPPPQISTGKHSLTLVAVPQEHYAGVSTTLPIHISRMPIQAEIQVPQTTILPESIQISGQVYQNLDPLPDARVELNFKGYSSLVKTSADGSFKVSIKTLLDLSLGGPQELTILIEPAEPWYASVEVKRWTLTINPVSSGLMLVAIVSLGVMLFSRARARPGRPGGLGLTTRARLLKLPTLAPAPGRKPEFTDIKGRILSAYLTGLDAVVRATGTPMALHITLREFLNAVTPKLSKATKAFTELTIIAESALYSAHKLDENTAARAERLADTIRQELLRGTA